MSDEAVTESAPPTAIPAPAPARLNDSTNLVWKFSSFEDLSVGELYAALGLRQNIFIVEQDVPYVDIDEKDPHCMHLMGCRRDQPSRMIAYMRIVPLHLFEPDVFSIGRVVVHADARRAGIARCMVAKALSYLDERRSGIPIKISSQLYLGAFYTSLGFVSQGSPYMEDRIPHIAMIRP